MKTHIESRSAPVRIAQDTLDPKPCICFVGSCSILLWGMTPAERLMRMFAKFDITDIVDEADLASIGRPVILIRADAVIDAPLVPMLAEDTGLLLIGEEMGHEKPIALHAASEHAAEAALALTNTADRIPVYLKHKARRPDELNATYWKGLRKREVPYALIVSKLNKRDVEWRTFMGTYKGATDLVTKHVWPLPAFFVTRALAPTSITPNIVTAVSAVFVLLTIWLFVEAQWIIGLIAAWFMTFLDTVDGKLARVTRTASKWGNIFDHGIDLIHPPFWYAAWGFGLAITPLALDQQTFTWVMVAIFVGYIAQRLMEGIAIKSFGLEIHIWRPIDTLFRQITARRNPNMVILTASALVGRPDLGLIAVAWWTLICLGLHGLQLLQAAFVQYRKGPLESWLNRPVNRR